MRTQTTFADVPPVPDLAPRSTLAAAGRPGALAQSGALQVARGARIPGIDAGKALAMVGVVLVHCVTTNAFEMGVHPTSFADQITRWSVPFFFVASGYLLAKQAAAGKASVAAVVARLAPVFLVWSLIYTALARDGFSHLVTPEGLCRWIVSGGAGWHLWFLPSLALCMIGILVMRRLRLGDGAMIAVALGVYAVSLLLGPYHVLLTHRTVDLNQLQALPPVLDGRGGPFPLAFVVAGYVLARAKAKVPLRAGFALFVLGGCLHMAEATTLDAYGWFPFVHNDFLVGTLAYGTGAFMIALHVPAGRVVRWIGLIGSYSLGIYVSHIIVLILLRKALHPVGLPGALVLLAMVFGVTTAAVLAATRIRLLRPLLT